jgi:hypothetical protein
MKMTKLRPLLFLALLLSSCVGGIKEEQKDVPVDPGSLQTDPSFSFEGIVKGEASSDSQIKLHFAPAQHISGQGANSSGAGEGSTSISFTYKITRDGSEDAVVNFVDANLTANINGHYVVSVPTQGRGDCATYNIVAIKTDNLESRSGKLFYRVCSEDEYYPVFEGVFSTGPLAGCNIYGGARLNWRVAEKSNELNEEVLRYQNLKTDNLTKFSKSEIDLSTFNANAASYDTAIATLEEYGPASYLVYYDTSNEALLSKLENSDTVPDAVVANPNVSFIDITGLTTGQTYYFAVRSSTSLITSSSKKNIEKNIQILSYDIPLLQPITFSGITAVDIPKDNTGYNSATLRYTACVGCDSYQYFARENSIPLDLANDIPNAILDLSTVSTNPSSYTLNGLDKHKNYYFYVVGVNACSGGGSPETAGETVYQVAQTTPPVAPFNGINNVSTVGGSLDRLQLDWDLPDNTNGVYDEYSVYLTDSTGNILSQLTNSPHATNPYIKPADDITLANTKVVTILNLTAGPNASSPTDYCFVVTSKESNFNGPSGVGRELAIGNRKVVCKSFYYQAPSFAGPFAGSCNSTSSTFEVSYPVPSDGTYSKFRLYYKKDEGEGAIDYDSAGSDTSTVIQGKGVGTNFTRIEFDYDSLATPTLTPPSFAGSVAANPFTVTGLDPDTNYIFAMETYYDPDDTGPASPFFVRPSVLRTCKTKKPDVIHQGWDHIMVLGKKTNGLNGGSTIKEKLSPSTISSLDYLGSGFAADSEKLDSWHMEEDVLAPDTEGHVFISWEDYKFTALNTYANTLVGGASTIQYVIKRSLNSDMTGATELGSVNLVKYIYLYHYYDNNIPTHSLKYYYQVALRLDGVDLGFSSINPSEAAINNANAILQVVVPPPNMSFIHRFMYNKHQCKRVDKNIWHGQHAFEDAKDDDKINFTKEANYKTRGARGSLYNSANNKNYDISNNYRCLYNGLGSVYNSVEDEYYFDIGKSFMVDRFEAGAKIGLVGTNPCQGDGLGPYNCIAEHDAYRGSALKNTLWYELGDDHTSNTYSRAYYNDIWINTSPVPSIASNAWTKVDSLDITQFSNVATTIFSNEAYLPPVKLNSPDKRKAYCTQRNISIGANTYQGRIGSRQEFVVFGGWHEQMAPYDIYEIAQRVDVSSTVSHQFACNTEEELSTRVPYQPQHASPPDLTKNNYPSRDNGLQSDQHTLRTGSYSSSTTEHSSHLCFSKFGIQDYVGNEFEASDDWFINAGGEWKIDLTKTPPEIQSYWLNTTKAPLPPLFASQDDYYSEYHRNRPGGTSTYNDLAGAGDNEFWNPLAGLMFSCRESLWGVPNYCTYERADNFTALNNQPDSMNYMFSMSDAHYFDATEGKEEGYPRVLNDVNDYFPFHYEYLKGRIRFPRNAESSPLSMGGAGYAHRRWETNRRSYESNLHYGVGSVYTLGNARPVDQYDKFGMRCVFTVD